MTVDAEAIDTWRLLMFEVPEFNVIMVAVEQFNVFMLAVGETLRLDILAV